MISGDDKSHYDERMLSKLATKVRLNGGIFHHHQRWSIMTISMHHASLVNRHGLYDTFTTSYGWYEKRFRHYWRPSDRIRVWHLQTLLADFVITWAKKQSVYQSFGGSSGGRLRVCFGTSAVMIWCALCYKGRCGDDFSASIYFEKSKNQNQSRKASRWDRSRRHLQPVFFTTCA